MYSLPEKYQVALTGMKRARENEEEAKRALAVAKKYYEEAVADAREKKDYEALRAMGGFASLEMLPYEILQIIVRHLGALDIVAMKMSCKPLLTNLPKMSDLELFNKLLASTRSLMNGPPRDAKPCIVLKPAPSENCKLCYEYLGHRFNSENSLIEVVDGKLVSIGSRAPSGSIDSKFINQITKKSFRYHNTYRNYQGILYSKYFNNTYIYKLYSNDGKILKRQVVYSADHYQSRVYQDDQFKGFNRKFGRDDFFDGHPYNLTRVKKDGTKRFLRFYDQDGFKQRIPIEIPNGSNHELAGMWKQWVITMSIDGVLSIFNYIGVELHFVASHQTKASNLIGMRMALDPDGVKIYNSKGKIKYWILFS